MYCNVPVRFPEQGIVVIVTEMFYEPEQKLTFYQEYLPAIAEPLAGYAFVEDTGESVDWSWAVRQENFEWICETLLKFVGSSYTADQSCMRV